MSDTKLKLLRAGQYELMSKLAALIPDVIKEATPRNMLFQSCIVCEYFQENEICKMFNVRPPARIIVFGCEKFKVTDDANDIPF